ncbi:MAG: DNA replication and repair protein RecF [Oligoflexia bacterium]|nr:DNA replication and repair protein RecF [Oligoflexia bacterium]
MIFLKKAELSHFRNYNCLSLDFSSPINIFVGDNGQGKSSFLEALYCALRGKSFHSFVSSQFIQKDRESSKVCLTLREKEGCSKIESSFFNSNSRLKRELVYCGKKVKADFLLEKFPCFVFTETSLKCIRQGPSERRNFIEGLFSFPWQNRAKSSFEKALGQKKQLLKNYKKGLLQEQDLLRVLKALNEKFLDASHLLVQARLAILNRLYSALQETALHFFKEPIPFLDFCYLTEEDKSLRRESGILSVLKEELDKKTKQEILAGMPLSGPHRHEIRFLFKGEDSRTFCSKGQQRSYVLSLLLSHVQFFPKALLFLDDVLLELDETIQKKFLKFLEKKHCQIFLTSCKMTSFKTESMSFFNVKEGQIEKLQ